MVARGAISGRRTRFLQGRQARLKRTLLAETSKEAGAYVSITWRGCYEPGKDVTNLAKMLRTWRGRYEPGEDVARHGGGSLLILSRFLRISLRKLRSRPSNFSALLRVPAFPQVAPFVTVPESDSYTHLTLSTLLRRRAHGVSEVSE